jgi:hypothetical protein
VSFYLIDLVLVFVCLFVFFLRECRGQFYSAFSFAELLKKVESQKKQRQEEERRKQEKSERLRRAAEALALQRQEEESQIVRFFK